MDYYEALGVPRNADAATIKKAYRRMSRKHHPDRGGDARAMVLVNKAYECLSDPEKRAFYDVSGTDKPLTSLEQQARSILIQTAVQIAAGSDARLNIVKAVAAKLREMMSQVASNISGMKVAKGRVAAHAALIECEDTENELKRAFLDQAANMETQVSAAEQGLEAIKKASELLKKYRSLVIEPSPDIFEGRYAKAVNWMGGTGGTGGTRGY